MTDLPSYRAEPDAEFADRLERELLRRLTDPAVATLTEVPLVSVLPETDDYLTTPDLEADGRRRRPSRIRFVAGGLVAAALVAVLALVIRNGGEGEPAVAPPVANGLIAFAGNPGVGSAQSDIYVRRAGRHRAAGADLDPGARRVRAHLVAGRQPPRLRANRPALGPSHARLHAPL